MQEIIRDRLRNKKSEVRVETMIIGLITMIRLITMNYDSSYNYDLVAISGISMRWLNLMNGYYY